jgi:ABC-2 type transport system ATP-binding protein
MADAIIIDNLRKTFGPKVAVDGFSLRIPTGSLTGFIGPNGAGKTTTIRMIMSILFPDSGQLSVLGKASAVESKDRIGYLPEERGIYRKMKVLDFVEYIAKLKGLDGSEAATRGKKWLEKVGLGEVAKKKCQELSKGMQQKVQFISAVIHEPELIILDEPFSGLDPVNSRLLRELIDEQHRAGRTIIFSTHQMMQAETLCDRVVMIHQGKKMLDATPSEISKQFDPRTISIEPMDGIGELSQRSRLEEQLREIELQPGVDQAVIRGRQVEVMVEEGHDPLAMMPMLAGMIRARRIELRRVSLEDVFINIAMGGTADEAGRQNLLDQLRASPATALAALGETSGD